MGESDMDVSSVGSSGYYQSYAAPAPQEEQANLALRQEREEQPTLTEMMKQAREKADQREKMFQRVKNNRRYGDAALLAYSKLARARNHAEVDAASGYARRQIAQLRAAKRGDQENADRIQAAINQLQKAVNRAGRKKRELTQEKSSAARTAKLEKEKRVREAKRQRHEIRRRQTQRIIRESGYLREADVDNRLQDQLACSRLELRNQMQELSASTQISPESAIQSYTASTGADLAAPTPEISVQA